MTLPLTGTRNTQDAAGRAFVSVSSFVPWIVALCALFAMLSERWLAACLGIALAALMLGFMLRHRMMHPSPLNLPLLLITLVCGISIWFITPLPGLSAAPTARLLLGIILYLAWSELIPSSRGLGWLAVAFALAVLALGLAAPYFIDWADKFTFWPALSKVLPQRAPEISEVFNPNVAGGTFAALLAAAAGALFFGAPGINTPRRLALLLLIALLGLDLALTQSRAALFAAAFTIAMLAALRWKWGWVLAAIGAAAAGAVILTLGPGVVWRSLTDVTGGAATFTSREEMWLRTRLLIADFPLTGIGVGTFPAVIAAFYPMKGSPYHAHNLFLQLGADLGIPGLLAWLGFFFILTGMALKLLHRRAAGALYPTLGGAALGFNAVLVLHGLLDCVLWGTRPAILVWIIWGLTAAAWNLADSAAAGGSAQPQIPSAQSPGAE